MPRRAAKNVFDLNRDIGADAPTEPPESLSGLLPRVEDLPPLPARGAPPRPVPARPSTEPEGSERARAAKPRGTGGRPAAGKEPTGGITKVPARVPADLYAEALPLVKGVAKPSWGQLIAWTCEDHPDEVREQIIALARQGAGTRRLRGQNRRGTAGLQVTARLDAAELEAVDGMLKSAQAKAEGRVNRTLVVLAALTVATRHPVPTV